MGIFFLIIGMLTSYLDFLTAPLITLGMPLVYLILLQQKQYGDESFYRNIYSIGINSFLWGVGYLGNWAAKWGLASIVLRRNVIADGLSQGFSRVGGVEDQTSIPGAIAYNLFAIIPPGIEGQDLKWFVVACVVILIILLILFLRFRTSRKTIISQIPLLVMTCYPYMWYIVMSNHSQIHYIFTYRIQIIAIWAGLMMYIQSIQCRGEKR